jgi:quercetin dioxygenase-like cupin family protein
MKIRRVVTGHPGDGKAVVASDTELDGIRLDLLPGFEFYKLWGADQPPTYPDDGSSLEYHDWFPPLGGFRFITGTVLPETSAAPGDIDEEAAQAAMEKEAPGLAATFEPDNPGMHTSDTVDLLYVVSGEVVLELDDGAEVKLKAGDTLVQSGTRHAWRNRSSEPCRIVAVLIGAHRSS